MQNCFHCGLDIVKEEYPSERILAKQIIFDDKLFCCNGCKTLYEIFSLSDMTSHHDFAKSPGAKAHDIKWKYDFLDNEGRDTGSRKRNRTHQNRNQAITTMENIEKVT